MKSKEVEVEYWSLLGYQYKAQVLIEYLETEEGKEIQKVYVSEYVAENDIDHVRRLAKDQFYNSED
jgi:hypothetical protein